MSKELEEAKKELENLLKQRNEKQVKITTYNLFEVIETVLQALKDSIPKEKVKKKIEELEKQRDKADKEEKIGTGIVLTGGIRYLEEILEE